MQSFQDIWQLVLKVLSKSFSETIMDLWFNDLRLIALNDKTAVLVSSSDMKADIVSKRYSDTMAAALESCIGFPVTVVLLSSEHEEIKPEEINARLEAGEELHSFSLAAYLREHRTTPPKDPKEALALVRRVFDKPEEEEKKPPRQPNPEDGDVQYFDSVAQMRAQEHGGFYNSEYTFENFIVGASNKFAHAACVAVANNPAYAYNPLFIYGPSGLGKTHLLYAITNRIREQKPDSRIVYVKGETFTNQLIEAIFNEQTAEFREKYRQADVFLIDDVQFIAGKESTQIEFFNTFNDLYEAKKQIILTSDRPPKEIKTLEDRLKTRFEWGLIVDIQPPDLELRVAILRKKAQFMNIDIPLEVLNYLAENLKSNIRQIEGAIKKIGAYSTLVSQPITIEMAKDVIADVVPGEVPVKITQDKILAAVAKKYGVTVEDLKGKRRTREIAMPRHICIYILRSITDMSLPAIGKLFKRDHTTIMSSIDAVEEKLREDANMEADIEELVKEIKNS